MITDQQYERMRPYFAGLDCVKLAQYSPFNHMQIGDLLGIYHDITGQRVNTNCSNAVFHSLTRLYNFRKEYEKQITFVNTTELKQCNK